MIKVLKDLYGYLCGGPSDEWCVTLEQAINLLRWRNVEEEMPEKEGWYLCYFDDSANQIVCYFSYSTFKLDGEFVQPYAWKPLDRPQMGRW